MEGCDIIAVVGALAAPVVFGTWKARPYSSRWVPLTQEQRQEIENEIKATNSCKDIQRKLERVGCELDIEQLNEGGKWGEYQDQLKYLAINVAVVIAPFAVIFAFAMVIPTIVMRYWRWLKT